MDNNTNQNVPVQQNGIPIVLTRYSEKKRERLSAMWASNRVNIVCVFFIIGGEIFGTLLALATLMFYNINVNLMEDVSFQLILNAALSILCLGIPALFMPAVLKTNFRTLYPLKYKRKGCTPSLVMFGLGIGFLGNYVTEILSGYIDFLSDKGFPVTSEVGEEVFYSTDPVQIAILLITTALVPAIFEEIAFRGVYLQGLRKYIGDSGAILYSALIFGLLHRNIIQAPFAFIAGLVFGYICIYTGSLIPGMIIHFLNNGISCIMSVIYCNTSEEISKYIDPAVFVIVITGCILSYISLSKKKSDFLNLPKVISNRTTGKRILSVIFSPVSILVILYCLFYIFLFIFLPALNAIAY